MAVGEAGLELGLLADLVGYRIRLAQIAAFKDFEETAKRFDSAPRYFGLLMLIAHNPGLPQSRLAEAIHLVRSSLVPILDRLEAEGLVERRSSPIDRRSKAVWLTLKGRKLIERLKPLVVEHEDRLTRGFTTAERRQLVELLRRVDQNLRSDELDAAVA